MSSNVTMKLIAFMIVSTLSSVFANEFSTELKVVTSQESVKENLKNKDGIPFETKYSEGKSADVPVDNGGNYGDLIYRYRENKDRLLIREVVISEELSSYEQDLRWTASINGGRITSVRVLNFGRSRAYCLRIDVAGGDVQIFLRVPPLGDPRVMIEVYGY